MVYCVIVDDELKSRETLKSLIEEFCTDAQVSACCQNLSEAVDAIKKFKPHVVFLDIQMQRESGFDLFSKIDRVDFEVIFTTAFSEYAIKAFKFSAIDYLLKPISIPELQNALAKVANRSSDTIHARVEQLLQNFKSPSSQESKLALPTATGLTFVKISDILYCEASSNYTEIFLVNGQRHIVSRTLKEYEELLSDYNFFRIHNSYLINLNYVKSYVRGEGGYVVLENQKTLDVSKRKKESFLKRFDSALL